MQFEVELFTRLGMVYQELESGYGNPPRILQKSTQDLL